MLHINLNVTKIFLTWMGKKNLTLLGLEKIIKDIICARFFNLHKNPLELYDLFQDRMIRESFVKVWEDLLTIDIFWLIWHGMIHKLDHN